MRKISIAIIVSLLAAFVAPAQKPVRILSLNNSLIEVNGQTAMFNAMAAADGLDMRWDKRTQLGRTLLFHYNDELSKALVASQPWDIIILQEQSSLPRTMPETLLESVKLWKKFIMANCPNPQAEIIIPMNWAYSGEWERFKEDSQALHKSFMNVARDIPGVRVCPVGDAVADVFERGGAAAAGLLYNDYCHPSLRASYLAACMEYGMITGRDPATITFVPDGLDRAVAKEMRELASRFTPWKK